MKKKLILQFYSQVWFSLLHIIHKIVNLQKKIFKYLINHLYLYIYLYNCYLTISLGLR